MDNHINITANNKRGVSYDNSYYNCNIDVHICCCDNSKISKHGLCRLDNHIANNFIDNDDLRSDG